MRIYTVWDPPEGMRADDPRVRTRFVREGFAWLALLCPVLWLLFHRMWLVLVLYLVVAVGAESISSGLVGAPAGLAAFAVTLVFAFEARGLYAWTLSRKGWRHRGVVTGMRLEDAERRWFDGERMPMPAPATPGPSGPAPWGPAPGTDALFAGAAETPGIFPDARPRR